VSINSQLKTYLQKADHKDIWFCYEINKNNLTEDGDLQFYTVDQQESSIFRVLYRFNLHCWLYSSSRSTFLKQKQKIFQKISSF